LSEECGVNTDVSVLDGREVVTLALEKVSRIVEIGTYVGTRFPAHGTASGKAQLIDLHRDELEGLLGVGPYPVLGPNTITDLDSLVTDLEESRSRGFASTDEELAAGLRSVAAPIRDRDRRIVAAICMTVPTVVKTQQELEEKLAPRLVNAARQLSSTLSAGAGASWGEELVRSDFLGSNERPGALVGE
jgi:IclR family pca regulon transcriptional regulator